MGAVVVDTSILLGLLDPSDSHHVSSTATLRSLRLAGDQIILPASALAEILVGSSRLGAEAVRTTERFVDEVVDAVHDVDRAVARSAASLRARHRSIKLPDAFVLAVGAVVNADAVLTADTRWARVDRRVRIVE